MVYLFYTTYISVDLAHHEIFRAKDGKRGIDMHILYLPILNMLNNACNIHILKMQLQINCTSFTCIFMMNILNLMTVW